MRLKIEKPANKRYNQSSPSLYPINGQLVWPTAITGKFIKHTETHLKQYKISSDVENFEKETEVRISSQIKQEVE